MVEQTIKEKIKQRRAQMLVHSYIYYQLDDNIVSDHTWQQWADELTELQNANPSECNIDYYDKEFKDWNGASGAFLPLDDPKVIAKAERLISFEKEVYNATKV